MVKGKFGKKELEKREFGESMIESIAVGGAVAVLGGLGLASFGYKRLSGVMPFLFANARVQARSSREISKNQFNALAEKKTLAELFSSLGETDFGAFEKASTARHFHSGIEKAFIEKAAELREMSPENFQKILDAYLGFHEAKIIKAFYRSRFFPGQAIEERLLFEVGEINQGLIQRLSETKTLADVKTVLASTSFAGVFSKEFQDLQEFEIALDSFVFKRFTETLKKAKISDKKAILQLLNTKLDILNLLTLLKCLVRNVKVEERKALLIENSSALYERAEALVEAKDLKELVEKCNGLYLETAMKQALEEYGKDNLLYHFEIELYRAFKKTIDDSRLYYIQGPYPLFSYLLGKEIEARNLMAISKGIESNFSKEEIRGLLL